VGLSSALRGVARRSRSVVVIYAVVVMLSLWGGGGGGGGGGVGGGGGLWGGGVGGAWGGGGSWGGKRIILFPLAPHSSRFAGLCDDRAVCLFVYARRVCAVYSCALVSTRDLLCVAYH